MALSPPNPNNPKPGAPKAAAPKTATPPPAVRPPAPAAKPGSNVTPAAKPPSNLTPAVARPGSVAPKAGATQQVPKPNSARPAGPAQAGMTGGATPGASGRRPSVPASIQADRAKLGLSSAKPSEMIAGLEEVAKRAEKQEAREEAKRKSGGKMSANAALQVDETGRRWAFQVKLGIAAALFIGVTVVVGLLILANRKTLSPREIAETARRDLSDIASLVERMERFDEGEAISADKVRARLLQHFDKELESVTQSIEMEKKNHRPLSKSYLEQRDMLVRLKELKDPQGKPYNFKMDDDDNVAITTQITSDAIKPQVRRVRAGKSKSGGSTKAEH